MIFERLPEQTPMRNIPQSDCSARNFDKRRKKVQTLPSKNHEMATFDSKSACTSIINSNSRAIIINWSSEFCPMVVITFLNASYIDNRTNTRQELHSYGPWSALNLSDEMNGRSKDSCCCQLSLPPAVATSDRWSIGDSWRGTSSGVSSLNP